MPATSYQKAAPTQGRNATSYQQTDVYTASPMQLVIMLYDECLRSLEKAERAFNIDGPQRIEEVGNNLLHAQDAITELAISLDMEKGGEIAHNLHRLYDFMIHHLSQANIEKSVKPIKDVQKMMADLREAWVEVSKQEPVQEQGPVRMSQGTIKIAG